MPPYDYGMSRGTVGTTTTTIGEEKYRVNGDLAADCESLNTVYDLLESSYNEMERLRATLGDDIWMGESKDAFMLLLEAISKFHLLLKDGLAQNKYALDGLDNKIEAHYKNSTIVSLLEV